MRELGDAYITDTEEQRSRDEERRRWNSRRLEANRFIAFLQGLVPESQVGTSDPSQTNTRSNRATNTIPFVETDGDDTPSTNNPSTEIFSPSELEIFPGRQTEIDRTDQ